eukprot:scpid79696/ scgid5369/ Programmed cell death protein 2; Zinc finger protein Rp-8
MSQDDPDVSLGFVAQPENVEHLKSKYFPSKMGGKPAWLSPLELPSTKDLTCPICKKPFVFLLQAYAPLEDQEECFHRTVFVFICRNGECYSDRSNRPFAVLRSQLPRKNNFYSFEPCKLDAGSKGEATFEELVSADDSQRTPLCTLCGCTGRLWCSRCRGPRYCGKDHQVMHWKHGHKAECQPAPKDSDAKAPLTTAKWSRVMAADAAKSILLPEMELVIESEVELEIEDEGIGAGSDSDGDEGESEEQQLKDFKTYVQSSGGKSGALDGEVSNEELQAAAADGIGVTDACFKAFKRKIAIAPEQVGGVLRCNHSINTGQFIFLHTGEAWFQCLLMGPAYCSL